jgi:hypothetical protein
MVVEEPATNNNSSKRDIAMTDSDRQRLETDLANLRIELAKKNKTLNEYRKVLGRIGEYALMIEKEVKPDESAKA